MKYKAFAKGVACALIAWSIVAIAARTSEDVVQLSGTALFSFTPDHYMLQTEGYIYKISKQGLSPELKSMFDQASDQGKKVNVQLPRSSVVYLWPRQPSESEEKSSEAHNKVATQLISEAKKHHGQISLKGQSVFSFSEDYILVQVGESVYQVQISKLSSAQKKQFKNVSIGKRLEMDIPQNAVSLVWNYKETPGRKVASVETADEVKVSNTDLTIKGTVIYSFNEPQVLVKSNNTFYQIQKNYIVTKTPTALDNPGSKIQLSIPIQAVEFVWTTDAKKIEMHRIPASMH